MDDVPVCPVCGCLCETFIIDKYCRIVGCNNCTEEENAEKWLEFIAKTTA